MGILSSFLSSKGADKALDAIVKGGDALVLTAEEKLQYQQEAMKIHLAITEKIAQESSPTSISRRIIGLCVLLPFGFLTIGSAMIFPLSEAVSEQWLEIAMLFEWPSLAVVGFYFGGHIVKNLKR